MLKTLNIENFTCFPKAELTFSKGLNVIVGENGTGKSHLLKLGYTVLSSLQNLEKSPAKDALSRDLASNFVAVFCPDSLGRLARRTQGRSRCDIVAEMHNNATISFNFSTQSAEQVNIDVFNFEKLPAKAVFIPPKEILSIFQGFQYTLEGRELQFDATYLDISKMLNGTPLKGPRLTNIKKHLDPLENLMGGEMRLIGQKFYFCTSRGAQLEAPLMAEGNRKLGMLSYLLKIGSLNNSSSLFWDEPEANLNPKLIHELAKILVSLSSIMQVTIATHSLFLLRELEILQENKELKKIKYFGLHLEKNGTGTEIMQGKTSDDIGDIVALDEALAQSQRYRETQYDK